MHPFRYLNFEMFQSFSWMKPAYLPYAYRGIIAFLIVNLCMLLVMHYMIERRLAVFAAENLQV